MRLRSFLYALFALLLLSPESRSQTEQRVKVVVSFSILADLVKQVGGDRVDVVSLVGPNTDMHVFQPSPADAKSIGRAQLVVINGLGFEGWADRLVKTAGYAGGAIVASKGMKALADRTGHGRYDPHAWQEVENVKTYIANIRDGLIRAAPLHTEAFTTAAERYLSELSALDREIRAAYADIPQERRKVITVT